MCMIVVVLSLVWSILFLYTHPSPSLFLATLFTSLVTFCQQICRWVFMYCLRDSVCTIEKETVSFLESYHNRFKYAPYSSPLIHDHPVDAHSLSSLSLSHTTHHTHTHTHIHSRATLQATSSSTSASSSRHILSTKKGMMKEPLFIGDILLRFQHSPTLHENSCENGNPGFGTLWIYM